MKQTITKSDFRDAFKEMGRESNFSYDGLGALFDYLEEMDENAELDVIAICCDFSEYENLEEFQGDYSGDYETIEDVENATTVIKVDDKRFIIQQF
jgi:hypothetical protein